MDEECYQSLNQPGTYFEKIPKDIVGLLEKTIRSDKLCVIANQIYSHILNILVSYGQEMDLRDEDGNLLFRKDDPQLYEDIRQMVLNMLWKHFKIPDEEYGKKSVREILSQYLRKYLRLVGDIAQYEHDYGLVYVDPTLIDMKTDTAWEGYSDIYMTDLIVEIVSDIRYETLEWLGLILDEYQNEPELDQLVSSLMSLFSSYFEELAKRNGIPILNE